MGREKQGGTLCLLLNTYEVRGKLKQLANCPDSLNNQGYDELSDHLLMEFI